MNVTHLECSLTGERYEAGKVHNLSRAGKPLLVRYDLEAAKGTLSRESLATREPGMWKWRELLPHGAFPRRCALRSGRARTVADLVPPLPIDRRGSPAPRSDLLAFRVP